MTRSRTPTPASVKHESALAHFRSRSHRVVRAADQRVGVVLVDFTLCFFGHECQLKGVNGDNAPRPSRAHISFGDANLLSEELLRLALQSSPLLGQQHGEEATRFQRVNNFLRHFARRSLLVRLARNQIQYVLGYDRFMCAHDNILWLYPSCCGF